MLDDSVLIPLLTGIFRNLSSKGAHVGFYALRVEDEAGGAGALDCSVVTQSGPHHAKGQWGLRLSK